MTRSRSMSSCCGPQHFLCKMLFICRHSKRYLLLVGCFLPALRLCATQTQYKSSSDRPLSRSTPDDKSDAREAERDKQMEMDIKSGQLIKRVVSKPESCSLLSEIGDVVEVIYTGYFTNGDVFDSSHGKKPISFTIGKGHVIEGWEEGVTGMCQGEKRRLLIPPHLGYGDMGFPPKIPPRTTLLFEVTLAKLHKGGSDNSVLDHMTFWLQLAAPPVLGVAFIVWIQGRYRQEVGQLGEDRGSRKSKRR